MGIFRQFPYSNFHEMNLDEIIKIMREMQDEWNATKTEWDDMKTFIENYFDNLDVSEEVLNALRVMASDGTLSTIIDPTIISTTTSWLNEHITQPTDPVIDSSLTVSGAGADAEVTGTNLSSIRNSIKNNASSGLVPFNAVWEMGGFNASTGAENNATTNYIRTSNYLIIDNIDTIKITNNGANNQGLSILRWDGITNTYLGRFNNAEIMTAPGYSRSLDFSNLTGYVRFSFKWSPTREMSISDGALMPIVTMNESGTTIEIIQRDLTHTNEQLDNTVKTENIEPTLSWEQGSVNTTNMYDVVNNLPNYIRSNIISVEAIDHINIETTTTDNYFVYCRCYDADGIQLTSEHKSITSTNILDFDVSHAYFVRLIIARTDTSLNVIPSEGEAFSVYFKNALTNALDNAFVMDNLLASFKRFAVIGDSLSAGHIYPNPDSTSGAIDNKTIAWGTFVTRKLDNTYYNFSRAGMSADQFVSGIHSGGGDLGDNKLSVALDGNHDVPMYIINLGVNNPNGLVLGSTADISLANPDNNANSIIGWYAKLVQKISLYYQNINQPVHIFLNVFGFMPAGGEGDEEERLRSAGRLETWTKDVYNYLLSTIESQGNFLHFIDLYKDNTDESRNDIFMYDGAVVQKHWTSVSYNAIGMLLLKAINKYMWNNSSDFSRIEFIASNSYITSYNNPSNFT